MSANRRKQVCLFGLSADPPTGHGGHVGIVSYLASLEQFDEVRVLPVYRHMYSNKRGRQASFEDRFSMCLLAFENLSHKVMVSRAEKECFDRRLAQDKLLKTDQGRSCDSDSDLYQKVKIGTADLLDMLIEDEPDSDFSLALGTDTFVDLTCCKWRRSEDILRLINGRVLVINRKIGNDANISSSTHITESRIQEVNEKFADNKVHAMNIYIPSLSSVSSSLVRSSKDSKILAGCLIPSVLSYIEQKQLYAFANNDQ